MHLFYFDLQKYDDLRLENEEHRHCIQVLRHKTGDVIHITDGKGQLCEVKITHTERNFTSFKIINTKKVSKKSFMTHIGIALTKQMERIEWFVEKVSEMGTDEISFITTENPERSILKTNRLEKKTISALKQSKGAWKTELNPLIPFSDFMESTIADQKFIAATKAENDFFTLDVN